MVMTIEATYIKVRNELNGRRKHEGRCESRPYTVLKWLRSGAVWVECVVCGRQRAIPSPSVQTMESNDTWEAQLKELMRRGL